MGYYDIKHRPTNQQQQQQQHGIICLHVVTSKYQSIFMCYSKFYSLLKQAIYEIWRKRF